MHSDSFKTNTDLINFIRFYNDDSYYIVSRDDPKPTIFKFTSMLSKN